jgi:hypothetical protein
MYAPIATALRIGLAFALTALLFLTGIYALFGGRDALAAYSLTRFGHLLISLAEIGGSVFLGALGGAVIAGPRRHVGLKSALLAGVACFACAVIVGSWYEGHRSTDTQYAPGSHPSTWFLWSAGNAIVFAFAITRLRGVRDND